MIISVLLSKLSVYLDTSSRVYSELYCSQKLTVPVKKVKNPSEFDGSASMAAIACQERPGIYVITLLKPN